MTPDTDTGAQHPRPWIRLALMASAVLALDLLGVTSYAIVCDIDGGPSGDLNQQICEPAPESLGAVWAWALVPAAITGASGALAHRGVAWARAYRVIAWSSLGLGAGLLVYAIAVD